MLQPICSYEDSTDKDDFVTDIKLVNGLHYLVASTNMGCIHVFKWDRKTRIKQFMHTFKSHTKAISSLNKVHANENYIVTASLDGSVKIWCLEKMIEIYSFDVWASGDGGLGDQMEKI
jgi:WD40 repeat protein